MPNQIFVITGPSGVGKGTLCSRLLETTPNLLISISATSRAPRVGEVNGINYHFYTAAEFEAMIEHDRQEADPTKHKLLEWARYNGNYYGTLRQTVEKGLAKGRNVILEIETQGALQIRQRLPEAHLIFIAPPDMETLAHRLRGRGTEQESDIQNRLKIAEEEMAIQNQFDVILTNDDLESCLSRLKETLYQFAQ